MRRRSIRWPLRTAIVAASLGVGLLAPAPAGASPTASATASFVPDKVGSPTSLVFSFQLGDTSGALPQPITQVTTMLPAGAGIDTTGLGICRASLSALAAQGSSACPSTSFAGFGTAQAAAVLGTEPLNETAAMTIYLAPSTPGHTVLDFFAAGTTPVAEQLAFAGTQEPASAPYGFQFVVNIPPIATVPGGPDASIVSLRSTIGAPNAQYYVTKRVRVVTTRRVGGRTEKVTRTVTRRVLQRVKGITVPSSCPAGGFPFEMQFTYADGTTSTVQAPIACP
jgi:hypothetical protein